jgi:hypothetical protein
MQNANATWWEENVDQEVSTAWRVGIYRPKVVHNVPENRVFMNPGLKLKKEAYTAMYSHRVWALPVLIFTI